MTSVSNLYASYVQLAARMWPSRRFCAGPFRFSLWQKYPTYDLSLFRWSWIWHFWWRWSTVPLVTSVTTAVKDSNAFSTL